MLGDRTHQRYCKILSASGTMLMEWHGDQNRRQRSADGSRDWIVEAVAGGYMRHVSALVAILSDAQALQSADFALSMAETEALRDDLLAEDDFADFVAQSVVGLASYRMRRNLTLMQGWPKRLFSSLAGMGDFGWVRIDLLLGGACFVSASSPYGRNLFASCAGLRLQSLCVHMTC